MKSNAEAIRVTEKFAQIAFSHGSLDNVDRSMGIVSDDIARHSMNLKMLSRDILTQRKTMLVKLIDLGTSKK
ncbi:MAG: hypothetical protein AAB521_03800 [Patescibacteria group bacterium]